MKKYLALLLVLVMIVCAVSMTACRGRNNVQTPVATGVQNIPTEPVKETDPTVATEPDNNEENWSTDTETEWSDGGQITTVPTEAPTQTPTQPTQAPTESTQAPTTPATEEPTQGVTADEEDWSGGDEWSSSSDIEWFE